jgi:hypothetical protein
MFGTIPISAPQQQPTWCSALVLESPWPPLWLSGWPLTNILGPGMRPRSTASFMPQSAPPASRIVVKP